MTNQPNNTPLTPEERPIVPDTLQGLFDSLWNENMKYESRIAELEKQLKFSEGTAEGLQKHYRGELKQAESKIAELERENEKLKDENLTLNVYNHSLRIANKKLMGLLEHFYLKYQLHHDDAIDWQSFCKEHNLTP